MTDIDFYRKQNEWSKFYYRDVNDTDFEKVRWVKEKSTHSISKILELGAGGGQFSIAAAKNGYAVTALEIQLQFTTHIKKIKEDESLTTLSVINDDFYIVKFDEKFDIICYWDGFGVGEDKDQKRLLGNVSSWLTSEGCVFIEIYTPWYWATKAVGVTNDMGDVIRTYQFDADACCLVDTWYLKNDPTSKTSQRLRCYSPADLRLLLENIDLRIDEIYSGGHYDFDSGQYLEQVPLHQAMTYTVKLVHRGK